MTEQTRRIRIDFGDPEEGVTATIDRLVLALGHHKVSVSALQTLIFLTAGASGSTMVTPRNPRQADLEELAAAELIKWEPESDLVRLT